MAVAAARMRKSYIRTERPPERVNALWTSEFSTYAPRIAHTRGKSMFGGCMCARVRFCTSLIGLQQGHFVMQSACAKTRLHRGIFVVCKARRVMSSAVVMTNETECDRDIAGWSRAKSFVHERLVVGVWCASWVEIGVSKGRAGERLPAMQRARGKILDRVRSSEPYGSRVICGENGFVRNVLQGRNSGCAFRSCTRGLARSIHTLPLTTYVEQ
jgi:hypothetical protein